LLETKLKEAINLLKPTIIEPKAYRVRFTNFARRYFIAVGD